jgi:excisionase family DNA binding protein
MLNSVETFQISLIYFNLNLYDMNKDFLNIEQAAEYLGVSKQTLYRLAGERKIVSYKPQRILYFKQEDLKDYILRSKREILDYHNSY